MDLRIQKTLDNIETAFLRRRVTTPLSKIKVNDLCVEARINKSTFYRHYDDVYHLSDVLENKIVEQIADDFSMYDRLFTDTKSFIEGMYDAVEQQQEVLNILFRDQLDVLAYKLGKKIKEKLLRAPYSERDDIMYSFIISGATQVLLNPQYKKETCISVLAELLDNMRPSPADGS